MSNRNKGQHRLRAGRWSAEGVSYFITWTTKDRTPLPDFEIATRVLKECLSFLAQHDAIDPICFVVIPDHVHLVFTLVKGDLAVVMNRLKTFTSREINRLSGRQGALWGAQYYEHQIRAEEPLTKIVRYCYENPVRKGIVTAPRDWPHWWCQWAMD